jgi:hypothetical protein
MDSMNAGWLSQTQTFTHTIDAKSPLHGLSQHDFQARGGIVHVLVQAMNGVALAPMVVTGNYCLDDVHKLVLFGGKLASMREVAADGASFTVDYGKLSSYQHCNDNAEVDAN